MRDSDSDIRPPPIPEHEEVSDEAKTIPATAAWEIVSETALKSSSQEQDTSLETLLEGNDDADSCDVQEEPVESYPEPSSRVWSKPMAAWVAIVSILVLAVYVKYYRPSRKAPSPVSDESQEVVEKKPNEESAPVKRVVVKEPFVAPVPLPSDPDLVPKQYRAALESIESTLIAIAGDQDPELPPAGKHRNLEELWSQIENNPQAMGDLALIQHVASKLAGDFATHKAKEPVKWEGLWKLGIAVYDTASAQMDSVKRDFGNREDLKVKKDLTIYRRWLAKWLLGERGVYCQVRQRFWEQVKSGDIPRNEKKRIGEVRKERERYLTRLHRRGKPLYDFCDRAILKVSSKKN